MASPTLYLIAQQVLCDIGTILLLIRVSPTSNEPKPKGLRGGRLYRTPMQPSWPTRSPQTHLTQRGGGRTPQTGSPCNLHDPHGHLSERRMEWEEDPPKKGSMHPHCPHGTPTRSNHPKKSEKGPKKEEKQWAKIIWYCYSPEKASICFLPHHPAVVMWQEPNGEWGLWWLWRRDEKVWQRVLKSQLFGHVWTSCDNQQSINFGLVLRTSL